MDHSHDAINILHAWVCSVHKIKLVCCKLTCVSAVSISSSRFCCGPLADSSVLHRLPWKAPKSTCWRWKGARIEYDWSNGQIKRGRRQGNTEKGCGEAWQFCALTPFRHEQFCAHANLLSHSLLMLYVTVIHRPAEYHAMSSILFQWAPAQPFFPLHTAVCLFSGGCLLWSHVWNGSFILKNSANVVVYHPIRFVSFNDTSHYG